MPQVALADQTAQIVAVDEINIAAAHDDSATDKCRGAANSNVGTGVARGQGKRKRFH